MMNLFEMMAAAQNGEAMRNLGQQFGLSDEQCEQAMRAMLPAFSAGLKHNTQSLEGLSSFLSALNTGQHAKYYESANFFGDSDARQDGENILGHMFGSPDLSRAVAQQAAKQTGIATEVLMNMLPYMATMVMGALFKQGQNPIADILAQMMGQEKKEEEQKPPEFDNPFGSLAEILMKGGAGMPGMPNMSGFPGGPGARGDQAPSGMDIFGKMFDADGDGSAMDDIFDAFFGGRRSGGRET